jgi:diguanylate cyclase (GGDEF)-like protein
MKFDSRFMRWIANQPIQSKLTLINVAVVFFALTPVVGITLSYEYFAIRSSTLQEAEVQADIIRDNIAAATAFHDRIAAAETLGTLRSSPNVLQAVVLLPHHEVLARYVRDDSAVAPILNMEGGDRATYVAAGIRVSRVVHLKEDVVGWLAVDTSTQPLRERIGLYLLVNLLATLLGFAIALPLAKWLKETITGPLQVLVERANRVTTHHDYSPPPARNDSGDEIGHLSRAFDSMLSGIRQRDQKLSQMAYYDNVTGLANRHYFVERLQQAVACAKQYGTRSCVMFIDLDDFKTVNDTFGHDVGDQLLRDVATALTSVSRDTDFVSRLGGDEFAIIVEDIKGLKGPVVLAEKIIAALSQPMTILGHPVRVGASIGMAVCPDHASETADILRAADTAMYWAKEQGKNCYRIFAHAGVEAEAQSAEKPS